MEDVKREIKEMIKNKKTALSVLKQKYPDKNINRDFIQGYLAGYEFWIQEKETSNGDAF